MLLAHLIKSFITILFKTPFFILLHLKQPQPLICVSGLCQNSPCSGQIIQTLDKELM